MDLAAAWAMIDAFMGLGVTNFDLTVVAHVAVEAGDRRIVTRDEMVPGRQLTGAHYRELRAKLDRILHEAEERQYSVILRPRPISAVLFCQLDDLRAEQVERFKEIAFLIVETSRSNHQVWVAIAGAPVNKQDFVERLRRGVGSDHRANNAGRLAGSRNFKPKHGPEFPHVRITQLRRGFVVWAADLERPAW
jgi:hypothetical protein